jgi:hypothetical protein
MIEPVGHGAMVRCLSHLAAGFGRPCPDTPGNSTTRDNVERFSLGGAAHRPPRSGFRGWNPRR